MKSGKFCFNKNVGLIVFVGLILTGFVLLTQATNQPTSTNSRADITKQAPAARSLIYNNLVARVTGVNDPTIESARQTALNLINTTEAKRRQSLIALNAIGDEEKVKASDTYTALNMAYESSVRIRQTYEALVKDARIDLSKATSGISSVNRYVELYTRKITYQTTSLREAQFLLENLKTELKKNECIR